VQAVQVMGRADRNAVVALVAAPMRAIAHVMIVKIAPRAAPGHRAAPSVTLKDRIAMPRRGRPLEKREGEDAFEGAPTRFVR